jgi:thiosulfate dehydrogenase [quinone] large subunit
MFMSTEKCAKYSLVALRIALGWLFLYAGATKVLNPAWSAAGYLKGAKTFSGFYAWLASPGLLPVTNFLNEWGLTLIGVALIAGAAVRLSGYLGAAMMVLYYFPVLDFPKVGDHSYIIDDHVIYALALAYLAAVGAGRTYGLDALARSRKWLESRPKVRDFLS